jgi:CPA2 family monovalent cation:H+ antiporter-2
VVNDTNSLIGHSIKDSGIREKTSGLVIGIERNNERILNPPSDTRFQKGDVVWLVGEREKIRQLIETG